MSPLAQINSLQDLDLSFNHLSRIVGLDHMISLLVLDLSNNLLTSTKNLSFCTNLHTLKLRENQIRYVEQLEPLQELTYLDLSFNSIRSASTDLRPLSFNRKLKVLHLLGNPCTGSNNHRVTMLSLLPGLTLLDGSKMSPSPRQPSPRPSAPSYAHDNYKKLQSRHLTGAVDPTPETKNITYKDIHQRKLELGLSTVSVDVGCASTMEKRYAAAATANAKSSLRRSSSESSLTAILDRSQAKRTGSITSVTSGLGPRNQPTPPLSPVFARTLGSSASLSSLGTSTNVRQSFESSGRFTDRTALHSLSPSPSASFLFSPIRAHSVSSVFSYPDSVAAQSTVTASTDNGVSSRAFPINYDLVSRSDLASDYESPPQIRPQIVMTRSDIRHNQQRKRNQQRPSSANGAHGIKSDSNQIQSDSTFLAAPEELIQPSPTSPSPSETSLALLATDVPVVTSPKSVLSSRVSPNNRYGSVLQNFTLHVRKQQQEQGMTGTTTNGQSKSEKNVFNNQSNSSSRIVARPSSAPPAGRRPGQSTTSNPPLATKYTTGLEDGSPNHQSVQPSKTPVARSASNSPAITKLKQDVQDLDSLIQLAKNKAARVGELKEKRTERSGSASDSTSLPGLAQSTAVQARLTKTVVNGQAHINTRSSPDLYQPITCSDRDRRISVSSQQGHVSGRSRSASVGRERLSVTLPAANQRSTIPDQSDSSSVAISSPDFKEYIKLLRERDSILRKLKLKNRHPIALGSPVDSANSIPSSSQRVDRALDLSQESIVAEQDVSSLSVAVANENAASTPKTKPRPTPEVLLGKFLQTMSPDKTSLTEQTRAALQVAIERKKQTLQRLSKLRLDSSSPLE
eukprot:GILK01013251.1.p1 GENE.GILK01013251.1~~GILK01013251.1.p1  ORF type:complete len:913 (+),score=147.11 GILK01013251.1:181-2739(+)